MRDYNEKLNAGEISFPGIELISRSVFFVFFFLFAFLDQALEQRLAGNADRVELGEHGRSAVDEHGKPDVAPAVDTQKNNDRFDRHHKDRVLGANRTKSFCDREN